MKKLIYNSNLEYISNKNLEYVNLKGEMIGQSLTFLEKCDHNPPNLTNVYHSIIHFILKNKIKK